MAARRTTQRTNPMLDLSSYFGPRNNNRFVQRSGSNYTTQALERMENRKEADNIAQTILSLFKDPLNISIYPGGIGGVIFALAEDPNVVKIYVSEPNANLQKMLLNNIRGYNLAGKIEVTSNYLQPDSSVAYIDIVKDPKFDIATFLQDQDFPLFVFRVPANYQAGEHPNRDCEMVETGNPDTALLICQIVGQEITPEEETTNVPVLDVDEEYLSTFIPFIDTLISKIIPDSPDREAYLQNNFLTYWVQSFTSKTVDPQFNYEVMEMLGDRLMKAAFADYIIQRISNITESQLTELQNYYLVKTQQGPLAQRLGMGNYIRTVGDVTVNLLEDVLEAFFGALFRVSEEVAGGLGYYNVFQMIVAFYGQEPIEEQLQVVKGGTSKTIVVQTFPRLHLDRPIENSFRTAEGLTEFTLTLKPSAREFFEGMGITLPPVIGRGRGKSKRAAENTAYTEALNLLRQRGISEQWIEEQRNIIAFDRPEYQQYLPMARERLQREGYVRMSFSSPPATTTTYECIVQLMGERANGKKEVLASTQACKIQQGRVEVLRKYANGE